MFFTFVGRCMFAGFQYSIDVAVRTTPPTDHQLVTHASTPPTNKPSMLRKLCPPPVPARLRGVYTSMVSTARKFRPSLVLYPLMVSILLLFAFLRSLALFLLPSFLKFVVWSQFI